MCIKDGNIVKCKTFMIVSPYETVSHRINWGAYIIKFFFYTRNYKRKNIYTNTFLFHKELHQRQM